MKLTLEDINVLKNAREALLDQCMDDVYFSDPNPKHWAPSTQVLVNAIDLIDKFLEEVKI